MCTAVGNILRRSPNKSHRSIQQFPIKTPGEGSFTLAIFRPHDISQYNLLLSYDDKRSFRKKWSLEIFKMVWMVSLRGENSKEIIFFYLGIEKGILFESRIVLRIFIRLFGRSFSFINNLSIFRHITQIIVRLTKGYPFHSGWRFRSFLFRCKISHNSESSEYWGTLIKIC